MSGYAFHPEAFANLEEIWEFIAQDDIEAAVGAISGIIAAIRAPSHAVQAGTRLPDEEALWMVAVMHGRRSPGVMAAILRERETG
jgi:plasmid stabilization system protein ParE